MANNQKYGNQKIISFDLDGTLVDRAFDDQLWFNEIPKLYARKHATTQAEAKEFCTNAYAKLGDKMLEWYDVFYWFKHFNLGAQKEVKQTVQSISHLIKPYPDALPVLQELSKQGCRVILVSNAWRFFLEAKLQKAGMESFFEKTFSVTSDFGKVKKTTDVYLQVCQELGVMPSQIIHVGDHLDFDFLVPKKLGITSILIDRTGESGVLEAEENVVQNLHDAKKIIQKTLALT